jgi:hypothetical protein
MPRGKIIPTTYKGITYRSRTEARWAIFLEALCVEFIYEHETYDLRGRWYLPDFWIPHWGLFVEVKGDEPTEEERRRCFDLAIATRRQVMLASGAPGERFNEMFGPNNFEFRDASFRYWGRIENCRRCDGIVLACYQDDEGLNCYCAKLIGQHRNSASCADKIDGSGVPLGALSRARNERFGVYPLR